MQSIKLARFVAALCVCRETHWPSSWLRDCLRLSEALCLCQLRVAAGQQFLHFYDSSLAVAHTHSHLFRNCKYLTWTCSAPWQGHLIQQQSALFRACFSCSHFHFFGLCLFAVHANKTFDGSTWRQPAVVVGISIGVLPATHSLLTYAAASISSTVHWLCLTFASVPRQNGACPTPPKEQAQL